MRWTLVQGRFRDVRCLLAFCLAALLSWGATHTAWAQGNETSPSSARGNDAGQQWVEHFIAPAVQNFAQQSRNLRAHFEQGCVQADADWLNEASAVFKAVVEAWSGIAFLRFGPLVEDNRYERLSFWPDPRGVMLRQVSGLLAQYEGGRPDVSLGQSSVAVQGLPALEYVLYRENGILAETLPPDERAAQCRYAADLTQNIASVANALDRAWQFPNGQYAQIFARPGANNPVYRNRQEVLAEGVKALSTGLQFVRDIQLAPAIMGADTGLMIKKMPYWRSGLTGQAIGAALEGMQAFVSVPGLLPEEQLWIVQQIGAELGRAAQQAESLDLSSATGRPSLIRADWMLLGQIVDNAKKLTDAELASALDVSMGFNALDGD